MSSTEGHSLTYPLIGETRGRSHRIKLAESNSYPILLRMEFDQMKGWFVTRNVHCSRDSSRRFRFWADKVGTGSCLHKLSNSPRDPLCNVD